MGIGERIRKERELLGLTQTEFAALGGASKNSQLSWEKEIAFPNAKIMAAWASAGADVAYILSGEKSQNTVPNKSDDEITHYPSPKPHTHIVSESTPQAYIDEFVHVPRYDVSASAGAGAVVNDESIVDHLAFKREWIVRTLGLDPKRLALLDVVGDSMTPTINDGDLILLDTREGQALAEGIYVINFSNSLLVKRLRMRLSGVVDVVSDNERYGVETISGEQLNTLQIVGRVVWQGRRI